MKRMSRAIFIQKRPESVFSLVSDPARYEEFFQGLSRWEPLSDAPGYGARYRVLMKVGSIEAGGTVRVSYWLKPKAIKWVWEKGVHQGGRWQLNPKGKGTELRLEVDFDLSGGPVGRVVEHLAGRIVARNVGATLLAARRILELEP